MHTRPMIGNINKSLISNRLRFKIAEYVDDDDGTGHSVIRNIVSVLRDLKNSDESEWIDWCATVCRVQLESLLHSLDVLTIHEIEMAENQHSGHYLIHWNREV
jgi:hypothetical protein